MPAQKRGRGGRRPGAGRRPLSPNEKQRNKVTVHFTDAEYETLRERAGEEPLAAVVRRIVVRALSRRRS